MFAGIVTEKGQVSALQAHAGGLRLEVESSLFQSNAELELGESICISGVCMTVVDWSAPKASFDVSSETVRKTTLAALEVGTEVNLERSLCLGDRIDGHLVFGHVDQAVECVSVQHEGETSRIRFKLPEALKPLLAQKGSIAIDGVSLTVGEVEGDAFWVYVIPHTLKVTTLEAVQKGTKVNLEVDLLARYIARQFEVAGRALWEN